MNEADDDKLGDPLDHALAAALGSPPLPADFHARLNAAWRRLTADELTRRRQLAETEHAQQIDALRRGFVRLRWETLALIVAVAFTAGAGALWAMPRLRETLGVDLSTLMPSIALTIGLLSGAVVWIERFGLPWRR